jgi:hypothetical protein
MPGFCNVSETLAASAQVNVCRWPAGMPMLRWTVVAGLPGFSAQSLTQTYEAAFTMWSLVSGVRFAYVPQTNSANILVGSRRIDGPAGVLAEAELPCGRITSSSQLRAWFDNSESWVVAENFPRGKMDLLRVAGHEFGHNLGIGHNTDGVTNSLMDPMVSHFRRPQNWDIMQAVMRYGTPGVVPPTEPDVPVSPDTPAGRVADILDELAKQIRKGGVITDFLNRTLG